jgi:monovalent cation:H+ antiporter-2, CPA2 family
MHNIDLILTLTAGLGAALVLGLFTQWLKLSPLVGYLLAGVVVGPYTPGYTADRSLAEQLAEVGVILLMFGVGLQLHVKELWRVRRVALPGAMVQIAVATGLGAVVVHSFGWDWSSGVLFGLAISVASTVVLTRVLSDNGELHTPTGHIAIGWLVVEDLFTVLALVILPAVFSPDAQGGDVLLTVALATVKIAALIGFTFLVGDRVIPRLLRLVVGTRSRELFTLAVLVIALGIAVGSALLFGASMALGAFLAGMIVGRSDFALRAASEALPMRDAFAVLFFVSVGMLFRPAFLLEQPWLVASTLGVVLIGKPLAAIAFVRLMRYPRRVALSVGVALAQVGEFSFIVAALGTSLGALPEAATGTLIAAAIVSITLNPIAYRAVTLLDKALPGTKRPEPQTDDDSPLLEPRALVVGYGPVGRSVARLLGDNGVSPTIIELNLQTVEELRKQGTRVIYGDATRREVLKEARVDRATAFIVSAPVGEHTFEIVREVLELNPKIALVVRCTYQREVEALRSAGATAVFADETEVALAVTEAILARLEHRTG